MGSEKETEMQKLYEAIGYTENEVITSFPIEVRRNNHSHYILKFIKEVEIITVVNRVFHRL